MRPFDCPVTILNTLDSLGKCDGKVDEEFLVGYPVSSKAFRVFNSRIRIVQETLHVNFLENKPNVVGSSPTWLFDIDTLTKNMNYQPVTAGNQSNPNAGVQEQFDTQKAREEIKQQYVLFLVWSSGFTNPQNTNEDAAFDEKKPESKVNVSPSSSAHADVPSNAAASPTYGKSSCIDAFQPPDDHDMPELEGITYSDDEDNVVTQTRSMTRVAKDQGGLSQMFNDDFHTCMFALFLSQEEPKMVHQALKDPSWIEAMQEELLQFKMQNVWVLVDLPYEKRAIGLTDEKSASTPIDTEKPLLKDPDAEDVDVHTYRSMIGLLIYLTSLRPDIMLANSNDSPLLGVNTPRSNEDRLELIELTVFLLPSDEKVGVEVSAVDLQVFAVRLMLLWLVQKFLLFGEWCHEVASPSGKKKKVVVMEATIRDALRLDDAKGVECLPNEEIFTELAIMGYKKPSTKLTFYKAFFSSQWKFLIHTILQRMSAKRPSWNEFISSMASVVICLSSGKGNSGVETPLFEGMVVAQEVGEGIADEVHDEGIYAVGIVTEGVVSVADDVVSTTDKEPSIPSPTPLTSPPQPSHDIPSTSQVQPTPPQSPQAQQPTPQPQSQPSQDAGLPMDILQNLLDTCTTLTRRVEHLEQDKIAQALEITKLKQRVKKLERRNKVKDLKLRRLQKVGTAQRIDTSDDTVMDDVSNQGRMIPDMDADVLEEAKDVADDAKDGQDEEESEPAELQEVVDIVTTAKIITEVVTATSTTIIAADVPVSAATTTAALTLTVAPIRRTNGVVIRDPRESTTTTSIIIHSEAKSKDKSKGILVEEPKPLKKQAQIEQDEKYARELEAELNINIDWDKVIDHVNKKAKEDPMDYFKGKSYDDIRPIFEAKFDSNVAFLQKTKEQIDEEESRALKRINETPTKKAAKRQKLNEEVEELKRHLQIVPNEEDDVYIEVIPLARKVPGVDYEIINQNNKPYYKIRRADGSHQLYLSFLSLLRNFDREDLEALWSLIKERFATTKPKNF
uniref:Ribonuclease H-like domain-containing protein n=1 Tax=Tanacetum cinerariifolium TaxID=118510 RepID=A0A6L2MUH0_TANCI|nr:ribonuclease H-like domain-containing protein [Tanacetum cinerariifolium]